MKKKKKNAKKNKKLRKKRKREQAKKKKEEEEEEEEEEESSGVISVQPSTNDENEVVQNEDNPGYLWDNDTPTMGREVVSRPAWVEDEDDEESSPIPGNGSDMGYLWSESEGFNGVGKGLAENESVPGK